MPDLRAMLGDRYHDVIIKATKRALFNYPNLPIDIEHHEALAGQALAAVLPDLLAQAWDEGHRASERDWEMAYDLSTPDEDRQPWTNPYRQENDHE